MTQRQRHNGIDEREPAPSLVQHSFARRVTIVYGIGLLFISAIAIVWVAAEMLLLVFAGSLLAVMLNGISRLLVHYLHLPRPVALGIVLTLLFSVLILGGYFMAPRIAGQIEELSNTIPQAIGVLEQWLKSRSWGREVMEQVPAPSEMVRNASQFMDEARLLFSGAFGAITNFVIILFVGIYLAAQPKLYINSVLKLLPKKKRARGNEVFAELGRTLELWLFGKAISMTIIGVFGATGLWLLDVPLAITLGLITGLLDFIPYLGPILGGIPALLIAFSISPLTALYVLLLFVGLQTLEGYLVAPLVERKTVSLPPAVTISMQVMFGLFFGLLGIALATPLAAAILVLITMLYIQDVLGDHVKTPSEHR
jgi:predicted PurR-regulated permease PerM